MINALKRHTDGDDVDYNTFPITAGIMTTSNDKSYIHQLLLYKIFLWKILHLVCFVYVALGLHFNIKIYVSQIENKVIYKSFFDAYASCQKTMVSGRQKPKIVFEILTLNERNPSIITQRICHFSWFEQSRLLLFTRHKT